MFMIICIYSYKHATYIIQQTCIGLQYVRTSYPCIHELYKYIKKCVHKLCILYCIYVCVCTYNVGACMYVYIYR